MYKLGKCSTTEPLPSPPPRPGAFLKAVKRAKRRHLDFGAGRKGLEPLVFDSV